MAPPLLVVTPTKGHVGWDEPVRDPVVCLPHSGRSLAANLEPNQMTGLNNKKLNDEVRQALASSEQI
ncbi:hypothetical protein AUC61_16665 [Pseudomonas sp. S25]|uniref:Uncharacterized protein n=1 Tax=Pseudomonas maioricensis TaxID=1766623 RepID=A0ABS9ZQM2_9PSED|nr:hypothetical protein [Pseudomonas sp. S25]